MQRLTPVYDSWHFENQFSRTSIFVMVSLTFKNLMRSFALGCQLMSSPFLSFSSRYMIIFQIVAIKCIITVRNKPNKIQINFELWWQMCLKELLSSRVLCFAYLEKIYWNIEICQEKSFCPISVPVNEQYVNC